MYENTPYYTRIYRKGGARHHKGAAMPTPSGEMRHRPRKSPHPQKIGNPCEPSKTYAATLGNPQEPSRNLMETQTSRKNASNLAGTPKILKNPLGTAWETAWETARIFSGNRSTKQAFSIKTWLSVTFFRYSTCC